MLEWTIWIGGFFLFWLPGVLLARYLRLPAHPDWLVTFALQIGLGLALWPVLLLWTTQAGWRWSSQSAQLCAGGIAALGMASLLWASGRWKQRAAQFRGQGYWLMVLACIVAITVVTRLQQVRGLALPVWVDPVQHIAIIRLLVTQGAVPTTLDPFIPDGSLTYHWGFHALVAWVAWLLGISDAFALADVLLHVGQLLNVLTVPMVYAAGRVLFAGRRAGLLAAAIVGLVAWFPAYFLSWGRYTHLTGVLLMGPALLMLWRLRTRFRVGVFLAAVLLIAGLGLVHVRVAFLAGILGGLMAGSLLTRRRWRTWLYWAAAAGGAILLTLPWWLWLRQSLWVRELVTVQVDAGAVWTTYNLPNWALVWAPRNPHLMALATVGVSAFLNWEQADLFVRLVGSAWPLLLIALAVWAWRHPRLREPTRRTWLGWVLLALWVVVTALLLQLHRLGLPSVRFIHINAGIITLFVPLGLAVGGLSAWALGLLAPPRWARYVVGVTALAIAAWGAGGMTTIVNPSTILATPADRAALLWIRDQTPADALFAVNTWEWVTGVYAGSDGGYWIPVLADRASLLPSVLYASALPRATVQAMNGLFRQLAAATNLDDPALRAALAERGVTHLYLGVRKGSLRPEQIDGRPYADLIYRQGGVSIYALHDMAEPSGDNPSLRRNPTGHGGSDGRIAVSAVEP